MKLPEYSLKSPVQADKDTEFPTGTIIFPFWNEFYVPEHHKQTLKEANRYSLSDSKLIMCIIGTFWVPVKEDNIRRRDFG
jgi:hypothetical protein